MTPTPTTDEIKRLIFIGTELLDAQAAMSQPVPPGEISRQQRLTQAYAKWNATCGDVKGVVATLRAALALREGETEICPGCDDDVFPHYKRKPPQQRALREGETLALADVIAERHRQIKSEGWTPEHDDEHERGEMAVAAGCYALNAFDRCDMEPESQFDRGSKWLPRAWPWAAKWWKPKDQRRDLVRAGALIIAEIERIDRKAGAK